MLLLIFSFIKDSHLAKTETFFEFVPVNEEMFVFNVETTANFRLQQRKAGTLIHLFRHLNGHHVFKEVQAGRGDFS